MNEAEPFLGLPPSYILSYSTIFDNLFFVYFYVDELHQL